MGSQKSNEARAGLVPKRERGRQRVAAIMRAAAAVFAEKGYDGATMAEIAKRSDTAIGSLYRFFPTKDALAQTLLDNFAERVKSELRQLLDDPAIDSPDRLTTALVKLMQSLHADRNMAAALLDGGNDPGARAVKRAALRQITRDHVARLLRKIAPTLDMPHAERVALVVWQSLKVVFVFLKEPRPVPLLDEVQRMIRAYIDDVIKRVA